MVHDVLLGGGAIVSPYGEEDPGIQSSHRNTTSIISTGGTGGLGKDAEGTISAATLGHEVTI